MPPAPRKEPAAKRPAPAKKAPATRAPATKAPSDYSQQPVYFYDQSRMRERFWRLAATVLAILALAGGADSVISTTQLKNHEQQQTHATSQLRLDVTRLATANANFAALLADRHETTTEFYRLLRNFIVGVGENDKAKWEKTVLQLSRFHFSPPVKRS